jgi:hypothetical protein
MLSKNKIVRDDDFISRTALAARWGCHIETLKRREKQGHLHPHGFSTRMVRYRLSEVLALEHEASGDYEVQQQASSGRPPRGRLMKSGRFATIATKPSRALEAKGQAIKVALQT